MRGYEYKPMNFQKAVIANLNITRNHATRTPQVKYQRLDMGQKAAPGVIIVGC